MHQGKVRSFMSIPDQDHINRVLLWMSYADEDLDLANYAMKMPGIRSYRLIAFHAQQCAEKYLKAYLVYHDIDFTLKDGRRPAGYEFNKTKRGFLDEWIKAVNQHGGFGIWQWEVSNEPADVAGILEEKCEHKINLEEIWVKKK